MTIKFKCNPTDSVKINSEFGPREEPIAGVGTNHNGVDIAGKTGYKIYTVEDGIVRFAGTSSGASSLGNYIIISHKDDTFCTLYGHLSQIDVSAGLTVNAGRRIGLMGSTGVSTGPHLHFEVRACSYDLFWTKQNGLPKYTTDPEPYLRITGESEKSSKYPNTDDVYDVTVADLGTGIFDNMPTFPYTDYSVDKTQIRTYEMMFGRRYKILVTNTNGATFDISDLHCVFRIKKTLIEQYNISNILIYNLNPTTESDIILNGEYITIEAGYEGNYYGEIFTGNIVQTIRSKEEGTDYVLEIIAVDAERFLSSGFYNWNIKRGQTQRDAIVQIAASNAMPIKSISGEYEGQKYIRGKVIFGKAKDYLNQLAKSNDANFYIDNGAISITKVSDVTDGEILRLNYDSGMIGVPTQTEYGMEVRTLLNPQLKCNILVQVDKENIVERQFQPGTVQYNEIDKEGVYRVVEITYTGDTRGQEWYCDLNTIIQAGTWPSMLQDPNNFSI